MSSQLVHTEPSDWRAQSEATRAAVPAAAFQMFDLDDRNRVD
jgi:hypothetical protein